MEHGFNALKYHLVVIANKNIYCIGTTHYGASILFEIFLARIEHPCPK
jgi:hypothetical protein